jgi:hypothetical protein
MTPKNLEKKLRKEEKVKNRSVEEKTETDNLRPGFSSEKVET